MTDLSVLDTGNRDGIPIVWLGSIGSSTGMWDRQLTTFADRYRNLVIDHPGHGASPPPTGAPAIATLADGVIRSLDSLGIDRAHFVGLSLGAMVAMSLAAHTPERVFRLALMCTSAHFGRAYGWSERADAVRAEGMSAVARATVCRWLTSGYAASHPDEVLTLVEMVLATDPDGYAWCCEAIGEMDLREDLHAVTAATLVVAGIHDPATPLTHAETIASLIPDVRIEAVDAAHLANWEQPTAVNDLLRAHLERPDDV